MIVPLLGPYGPLRVNVCNIVQAYCVLHNICQTDDEDNNNSDVDDTDDINDDQQVFRSGGDW